LKKHLYNLKEYLLARAIYTTIWIIFTFTVKGRFVVLTKDLSDGSINYIVSKVYPKGTVFYIESMATFKQAWNGYKTLIIAIDLKTKEPISVELIPDENCKVLPYNELSKVLYGFKED
jgi:hypothetical protein